MMYGTQKRADAMVVLIAIFMQYGSQNLRRAARNVGIAYLTGLPKRSVAERLALRFINHHRTLGMSVPGTVSMDAEARNAWGTK